MGTHTDECHAKCRFMVGSSDSDSDDDKRVVRSAKDRRFDELKGTCEEMRVCSPSLVFADSKSLWQCAHLD